MRTVKQMGDTERETFSGTTGSLLFWIVLVLPWFTDSLQEKIDWLMKFQTVLFYLRYACILYKSGHT